MAGQMEQRMSGVLAALEELKTLTAQMAGCVVTAAQSTEHATNVLMSGIGPDAFHGTAATTVVNTIAGFSQRMQSHADAANKASYASGICHDRLQMAAARVDQKGWGVEAFVWVVNQIDAEDVMMHGATGQMPGLLAAVLNGPFDIAKDVADWLLSKELPAWAEETQAATSACIGALAGITADVVAGGNLGPIATGPAAAAALTAVTQQVAQEVEGTFTAGIATELTHYLRYEDGAYLGIDMAALAHDHPDWVPYVQAILNRGYGPYDIQCVAFMDMVLAIADKNAHAQPYSGNAVTYWDSGRFPPPHWLRVPNGTGLPQPGDVVVMADGGPGHVAIVTSVSLHPPSITFANGNAGKTMYTFPMTADGKVTAPWRGYTVLGFIRQTGK